MTTQYTSSKITSSDGVMLSADDKGLKVRGGLVFLCPEEKDVVCGDAGVIAQGDRGCVLKTESGSVGLESFTLFGDEHCLRLKGEWENGWVLKGEIGVKSEESHDQFTKSGALTESHLNLQESKITCVTKGIYVFHLHINGIIENLQAPNLDVEHFKSISTELQINGVTSLGHRTYMTLSNKKRKKSCVLSGTLTLNKGDIILLESVCKDWSSDGTLKINLSGSIMKMV